MSLVFKDYAVTLYRGHQAHDEYTLQVKTEGG